MWFRSYTNAISQASKTVAAGIFIVGLVLIGFAFMIYLLPRLFATLAAIVFFVAGAGCATTAIKMFWAQRKLDRMDPEAPSDFRENVHIRIEQHHDL